MFPKDNEARIADAILELFRKRENLDVFNKKALYIYIREMVVDVKTPQITKAANKLYDIFKSNYPYYLETGIIKFV
jgi:16S rRNA A1518/A1519 N6-dimethyltransferase RsmA/KsgA/DIM1 with predicted DNA glycosylase/AP lyase activity